MKSIVIVTALCAFAVIGCAVFGPAERAATAGDAANIERCQEEGRACKQTSDADANCYAVYDACMKDAGMR